jgi:hypothetical protein
MNRLASTGVNPAAEPDTVSYNIVMNSYAKSGQKNAPHIVEKLLLELEEMYEASGDWRRKPNSRSINTYLDAWAKSGLPESAERILDWIEQMNDNVRKGKSRITPDKWAYNVSDIHSALMSPSLVVPGASHSCVRHTSKLCRGLTERIWLMRPNVFLPRWMIYARGEIIN